MTDRIDWIAAQCRQGQVCVWPMGEMGALEMRAYSGTVQDLAQMLSDIEDMPLDRAPLPILVSGATDDVGSRAPGNPAKLLPVLSAQATAKLAIHEIPAIGQDQPVGLLKEVVVPITGFLNRNPKWDGVLCMPGLQTHWVHASAGEIVSFQSFLSFGLMSALSDIQSPPPIDPESKAFANALSDTMSRPERLASQLAQAALGPKAIDETSIANTDVMCGALIGAEMAAAKPYWLGQDIIVMGSQAECAPYLAAMAHLGLQPIQQDRDACSIEGFAVYWSEMQG